MPKRPQAACIDDYLLTVAPAQRALVQTLRAVVQRAVPDAHETIGYRMPAFRRGRIFIYFAVFKTHVGMYPPVKDDPELVRELAPWRGDKGNLRFALNQPLPVDLIARVAQALARQYGQPLALHR